MSSNPNDLIQWPKISLSDRISQIGRNSGDLVSGLKNFGQSASNAIADQVAIPVDAIAWLLRKAGAPIPSNPVGGSDWMREKGLTAPAQDGISKLGGELLGNLMHMGLNSQVAGQIAKQLNKGIPKNVPVGMSIKDLSAPQAEAIKKAGIDAVHEPGYPQTAFYNPENLRSRFAAFDPWRATAATAALYGVAASDLLAAESQPRKKK